jgi:hypothetical protein
LNFGTFQAQNLCMHNAEKILGAKTTVSYLLTIVYGKSALCSLCMACIIMRSATTPSAKSAVHCSRSDCAKPLAELLSTGLPMSEWGAGAALVCNTCPV